MQKFSDRLIALRKERDLTQEELAKIINKTRSSVSGYETENKEPSLELVCALAEYFGVSTDYLLGHSDERNHTETVFFNDTINFQKTYKATPLELRPVVSKSFDSFYLLLNRDMKLGRPERLLVYQELFHTLQSLRADIRRAVEQSGGAFSDPVALSDLMALQSQLKNEVCALLDKLLQADMEISFDVKKGEIAGLSSGSAM